MAFQSLSKKATTIPRVAVDSASLHAEWIDNTTMSSLVIRSSSASNDVIHDKLFLPGIVSIGVVVIICVICCYQLIVTKKTLYPREPMGPSGLNGLPILSPQYAVGGQQNGYGDRLSRGLSKATRSSGPSASIPGSPSVRSDQAGQYHLHLQQQRQHHQRELWEQQRRDPQAQDLQERDLQEQDPYRQYMMIHGQGHPQQYQHTPSHPSRAGSVVHPGDAVQPPRGVHTHATQAMGPDPAFVARAPNGVIQSPQPPLLPHVTVAGQPAAVRHPSMNAGSPQTAGWEEQHLAQQRHPSLQRQQPDYRNSLPSARASTGITSDVLSYMTPPEARRQPLPSNHSQLTNQDYFSSRPAATSIPLPLQPGSPTHGNVAPAVPVNYSPASRVPPTTNSAHSPGYTTNEPPGYVETRNDVQGKMNSTTPHSEKHHYPN